MPPSTSTGFSQTPILVTGVSLVSALGESSTSSWQNLCAGQTGIKTQQPYPELNSYPLALIGEHPAACLEILDQLLQALLEDANLHLPLANCGVVIGSSRGFQQQWEAWLRANSGTRRDFANTFDGQAWWQSLPQALGLQVAKKIKTPAPVLSPSAACATGIWAIAHGKLLIESGQCQQVIVGAVESPVTPLTLAGFHRMGALSSTGAYPFDQARDGFALGEGGALLLLETLESAQQRQAKIYGQVSGVGLTADATFLTAPHSQAEGMINAVKMALSQTQLSATEVDLIHAHGTGTPLSDQAEARWIETLCPQALVSGSKGATGHTLGAAGSMAAIFSLLALRNQTVFPTVGLRNPEFNLKFVTTAQAWPLKTVLTCSYGFGGQNAVVAFQKWRDAPSV